MRTLSRKGLKKKLDLEWARIVKLPGICLRCRKDDNLQAAHIFSRGQMSTRWTILNGICLCSGCHKFWGHLNPVEFTELAKAYLGEYAYQQLRIQATSIKKWTRDEMEDLLQVLRGIV